MKSFFIKFIYSLSLILTLSTNSAFAEKQGPECGGGGNSVLIDDRFYLLDLFNVSDINLVSERANSANSKLSSMDNFTEAAKVNSISLHTLQSWGFDTSNLTIASVKNTTPLILNPETLLKYTNEQVPISTFYFPSYAPTNAPIFQAAYFSSNNNEITISRAIWSRMDPTNKLALMIHENLRLYQFVNRMKFNDKLLQNLTLMILVCKPDSSTGRLIDENLKAGKTIDSLDVKAIYTKCLRSN